MLLLYARTEHAVGFIILRKLVKSTLKQKEGEVLMDYLQISNLPIMWLLCGVTVIIAALQAVLFIRTANKAAKACSIDPAIPKKAFRVGLISAIGPALGVFIVMVGLMSAIGGPMSWLRLSIIGATAAGVTLGGDGYTLEVLAVSWFAMALNGAG